MAKVYRSLKLIYIDIIKPVRWRPDNIIVSFFLIKPLEMSFCYHRHFRSCVKSSCPIFLIQQLGRVMEGWKKRDEEKEEIVAKVQAEKEDIEQKMVQQQKVGIKQLVACFIVQIIVYDLSLLGIQQVLNSYVNLFLFTGVEAYTTRG